LGKSRGIEKTTSQQADEIWQFVEQHREQVGAVVVHCEAGVSRSPTVAAALCKGMGGDDRRFFRRYQPNMHVYRLMLEAARRRSI
jgi:protein-tyrosine phosphatase